MPNYATGYFVATILKIVGGLATILGAIAVFGGVSEAATEVDGFARVGILLSLNGLLVIAAGYFLGAHFDIAKNSFRLVELSKEPVPAELRGDAHNAFEAGSKGQDYVVSG